MPDNPVSLTLPAPSEGLTLLTQTLTNADIIGHFDGPDFGPAVAGEFQFPIATWLLCDFSTAAIPTGPNTTIRNTPAPSWAFSNGINLPFDAADRVVGIPHVSFFGPNPSADMDGHRLELGFGASSTGGNAANRCKVVTLTLRVVL